MTRREFNFLVVMSLMFCISAAYSAMKMQIVENQFGPLGLHDINSPPGFYHLNFMWYPAIAFAVLPIAWIPVEIRRRRRQRREASTSGGR